MGRHTKTKCQPPRRPKAQRDCDLWGLFLLIAYLLLLIWVIIFKADFSLPYVREERAINFIPFHYGDGAGPAALADILLNVLVFIPLGVYLPMRRVRWWQAVPAGLGLSLLFELTQLAFAIGVTDVTDLITNTAGCALGVGVYALLCRISRDRQRLDRRLRTVATVGTGLAYIAVSVLLIATLL